MAGRPKTMAKRVAKLVDQQRKINDKLRAYGKHHIPKGAEPWFPRLPEGADCIRPCWRWTIYESQFVLLHMEALQRALAAKAAAADQIDADDLDDEDDEEQSPEG